jgi:hypothetical protein
MTKPTRPFARRCAALVVGFSLLGSSSACARSAESISAPPTSEAASVASSPGAQPTHISRKQIIETTLSLTAQRPRAARQALERKLQELGGFVQLLNTDGVGADVSFHFVLRVPEQKLAAMLTAVRALGSVSNESQEAKDVTREYVDVDARLRNLTRSEERLLALLANQSGALADVIAVEQELTRVRGEAEQLTAQLRALDHDVALATLTVFISPTHTAVHVPDDAFSPVRELWADASGVLASSAASLLWVVSMTARALIALVPWLPVLALTWFGARKLWSARRRGLRV